MKLRLAKGGTHDSWPSDLESRDQITLLNRNGTRSRALDPGSSAERAPRQQLILPLRSRSTTHISPQTGTLESNQSRSSLDGQPRNNLASPKPPTRQPGGAAMRQGGWITGVAWLRTPVPRFISWKALPIVERVPRLIRNNRNSGSLVCGSHSIRHLRGRADMPIPLPIDLNVRTEASSLGPPDGVDWITGLARKV